MGKCLPDGQRVLDGDNNEFGNRRIRCPQDICDLGITCRLNGEMRQMASTREMTFGPARLVAHITTAMTLWPGDIIMTGTPVTA